MPHFAWTSDIFRIRIEVHDFPVTTRFVYAVVRMGVLPNEGSVEIEFHQSPLLVPRHAQCASDFTGLRDEIWLWNRNSQSYQDVRSGLREVRSRFRLATGQFAQQPRGGYHSLWYFQVK